MNKRQAANYKLIEEITAWVAKYPDQRFHQILANLDINLPIDVNVGGEGFHKFVVNEYNTEPDEVLKRVLKQLEKYEKQGEG